MPPIALSKSDPATVAQFTVEQVVSIAGNGKLSDGSQCSEELREYFSGTDTETLSRYAEHCLTERFEKSGQVLQDIVNELGRRLEYTVVNGLYAGKKNATGNDGLWHAPEGQAIIVEVKTTDAYRIPLDVIAKYRSELIQAKIISGSSSMLIVVGREDTGELEAQVRGSRHAWDIRLISVEALVKLVLIKENSEETETGKKIRGVLIPIEYTRVDRLVDVVFAAASDAQEHIIEPPEEILAPSSPRASKLQKAISGDIQLKRELVIDAVSQKLLTPLIKRSRAMYWSADHSIRVVCAVSKHYASGNDYWYAFHSPWRDFLSGEGQGYFVLGCMDLDRTFSIPIVFFAEHLGKLNTTERVNIMYWHVKLNLDGAGNVYLRNV